MLTRLKTLFRSKPSSSSQVIPLDQHGISHNDISQGALSVMKRLHGANFDAHLVGGGVRDLLLGGQPKDFDIATEATPEQVKQLFRGARIIGRRFRIVHVRMGREIIEVTTYRANHDESNCKKSSAQSSQGMLLRDNVYGDLTSDAIRRDFTINALYYSSADNAVRDFANGMQDIQARQIRIIGEPEQRYKEDPVRMLRAIRFAAKLEFDIEARTAKPIAKLAGLLSNISSARLFDEVLKLFLNGAATKTYPLMKEYGLFQQLFPATAALLTNDNPTADKLIQQTMINTDERILSGKRITPAFLLAALLWPVVQKEWQQRQAKGVPPVPAMHQAIQLVTRRQVEHTAIPKRFQQTMREIWELQLRLPKRHGNRASTLVEQPRFRAGYDFLLVREASGEALDQLGDWWTRYQDADTNGREAMVNALQSPGGPKKRKRRRRSKPKTEPASQPQAHD